jgi:hypothetical protein
MKLLDTIGLMIELLSDILIRTNANNTYVGNVKLSAI